MGAKMLTMATEDNAEWMKLWSQFCPFLVQVRDDAVADAAVAVADPAVVVPVAAAQVQPVPLAPPAPLPAVAAPPAAAVGGPMVEVGGSGRVASVRPSHRRHHVRRLDENG